MDYGFQKSTTKNNNLNPVYGETFHFAIPTLKNMVLKCVIMDEDGVSRDDKLGWCKFKLDTLGLTATPKAFREVVDRNLFTSNAEIFVELSYT